MSGIYETALAFARDDGRPPAPPDLIAAARLQASSGDLRAAIASYEAAVSASVGSPLRPPPTWSRRAAGAEWLGGEPPRPPAEVLLAWLPEGE